MSYFLLKQDPTFTDAPTIINWYGKINEKNISIGKSHLLERRILLNVMPNKNLVFPPVLTNPFFLFTREIKKSVDLYEKRLAYKEIVLLDSENMKTEHYYMPILPKVDCLSEQSTFNLDHSILLKAVIVKENIPPNAIFLLEGVGNRHIVIRLDLAESILRKSFLGIHLIPIEEV